MKAMNKMKLLAGVMSLAVVTSLAACGNRGSDSPPVVQGNAFQQCLNCQNINGGVFFQAESQDSYGAIRLNWAFSGQAGNFNQPQINQFPNQYPNQLNTQYNSQYPNQFTNQYNPYPNQYNGQAYNTNGSGISNPISYSGQVAAQGILTVASGMSLGYCQLPAGSYTLGTLTPGQWSAGMVSNLKLQATGPAVILLSLTQGQVAAKTGSQLGQTWSEIPAVGRIFGNVMIESVNGYACSMSVLVQ